MTIEDLRILVPLVALALSVGSIVWQGGRVARVVEQLSELIKDHEQRLRDLEKRPAPRRRKRTKR